MNQSHPSILILTCMEHPVDNLGTDSVRPRSFTEKGTEHENVVTPRYQKMVPRGHLPFYPMLETRKQGIDQLVPNVARMCSTESLLVKIPSLRTQKSSMVKVGSLTGGYIQGPICGDGQGPTCR